MVQITYTMATRDSPDTYARTLGPAALGLGHIYQANPSWQWYNYYILCVVACFVFVYPNCYVMLLQAFAYCFHLTICVKLIKKE